MADIIRLSHHHSFRFPSSSLLPSFSASSVNTLHPVSLPCTYMNSEKRFFHSASPFIRSFKPFAIIIRPRKQLLSFKVQAAVAEKDRPKWWERSVPNMVDIHSTQEFLSALSQAGDRLVIVEFYGTWCASCRALFPKLCRTAEDYPEILFLKVNFDENKSMCKSMNVKVLPFFHFYRGADGQLESFSCSLAKFQKIKDAIATHSTDRCSIGPPRGVGELELGSSISSSDQKTEASSSSSSS